MSSDRPANIRDLPVEDQDAIQDALQFYLDAIEEDFLESPEENRETYLPSVKVYHDLTGGWRERGQQVFDQPAFLDPHIDNPRSDLS